MTSMQMGMTHMRDDSGGGGIVTQINGAAGGGVDGDDDDSCDTASADRQHRNLLRNLC